MSTANRPEENRTVIRELERYPDARIIIGNRVGLGSWDGVPKQLRHFLIADYLFENYEVDFTTEYFTVLKRRTTDSSVNAFDRAILKKQDSCVYQYAPFYTDFGTRALGETEVNKAYFEVWPKQLGALDAIIPGDIVHYGARLVLDDKTISLQNLRFVGPNRTFNADLDLSTEYISIRLQDHIVRRFELFASDGHIVAAFNIKTNDSDVGAWGHLVSEFEIPESKLALAPFKLLTMQLNQRFENGSEVNMYRSDDPLGAVLSYKEDLRFTNSPKVPASNCIHWHQAGLLKVRGSASVSKISFYEANFDQ